ncbi:MULTISPECIES: DUF1192 domain-containing protein [Nitrospirillum]|uniref:DUF1192 domain-containing protein n=3 Tax=Nitrospirillum TaxID=1543705 RepID=A0A248JQW6_9PROT|nr:MULTISPECIES: DUF1192 domain-containing protein [Nitrospirillum]MEE3626897.1 DUF1192 domain-containing protein [Nitrospirillum sp. BR 11752]ASG21095.1 DUF1192 domain-containing protein [Nitrospirillum amazonense CBAmc]MDG3442046.1 DUF1192 domain-containing protein [Nitrospirillum amazonense]MDZ5647478.1 DUF1192 domain-containing protein [Nitrospirillum sp. BR 11828]MEA1676856.1 DUF1192 domain-containing protein [Nitrospirillum sp. BR 11163]
MDTDDIAPPPSRPSSFLDIARLSVGELREYRNSLEAEIARVDDAIKAKQASLNAAAAFFKS